MRCEAAVIHDVGQDWNVEQIEADVGPDETFGIGIGIDAVRGAAIAGAGRFVAVDPTEFEREEAMETGGHLLARRHRRRPPGDARRGRQPWRDRARVGSRTWR